MHGLRLSVSPIQPLYLGPPSSLNLPFPNITSHCLFSIYTLTTGHTFFSLRIPSIIIISQHFSTYIVTTGHTFSSIIDQSPRQRSTSDSETGIAARGWEHNVVQVCYQRAWSKWLKVLTHEQRLYLQSSCHHQSRQRPTCWRVYYSESSAL